MRTTCLRPRDVGEAVVAAGTWPATTPATSTRPCIGIPVPDGAGLFALPESSRAALCGKIARVPGAYSQRLNEMTSGCRRVRQAETRYSQIVATTPMTILCSNALGDSAYQARQSAAVNATRLPHLSPDDQNAAMHASKSDSRGRAAHVQLDDSPLMNSTSHRSVGDSTFVTRHGRIDSTPHRVQAAACWTRCEGPRRRRRPSGRVLDRRRSVCVGV